MFFGLLQLVRVFCTEKVRKRNGQVVSKPQVRLLLINPGGTFLQIYKDIYVKYRHSVILVTRAI